MSKMKMTLADARNLMQEAISSPQITPATLDMVIEDALHAGMSEQEVINHVSARPAYTQQEMKLTRKPMKALRHITKQIEGEMPMSNRIPPMPPRGIPDITDPTNRDTVPAMLTSGEFVLNREAAQMYAPQVEAMNNHGLQQRHAENVQHLQNGGYPNVPMRHNSAPPMPQQLNVGGWLSSFLGNTLVNALTPDEERQMQLQAIADRQAAVAPMVNQIPTLGTTNTTPENQYGAYMNPGIPPVSHQADLPIPNSDESLLQGSSQSVDEAKMMQQHYSQNPTVQGDDLLFAQDVPQGQPTYYPNTVGFNNDPTANPHAGITPHTEIPAVSQYGQAGDGIGDIYSSMDAGSLMQIAQQGNTRAAAELERRSNAGTLNSPTAFVEPEVMPSYTTPEGEYGMGYVPPMNTSPETEYGSNQFPWTRTETTGTPEDSYGLIPQMHTTPEGEYGMGQGIPNTTIQGNSTNQHLVGGIDGYAQNQLEQNLVKAQNDWIPFNEDEAQLAIDQFGRAADYKIPAMDEVVDTTGLTQNEKDYYQNLGVVVPELIDTPVYDETDVSTYSGDEVYDTDDTSADFASTTTVDEGADDESIDTSQIVKDIKTGDEGGGGDDVSGDSIITTLTGGDGTGNTVDANGNLVDRNGKIIKTATQIAAESNTTPDEANSITKSLKDTFGSAFKDLVGGDIGQSLAQGLILYLGAVATGASRSQAMAFAGKSILQKGSDATQDFRAYRKYIHENPKAFDKDSIRAFMKSRNPNDLVALEPETYSPYMTVQGTDADGNTDAIVASTFTTPAGLQLSTASTKGLIRNATKPSTYTDDISGQVYTVFSYTDPNTEQSYHIANVNGKNVHYNDLSAALSNSGTQLRPTTAEDFKKKTGGATASQIRTSADSFKDNFKASLDVNKRDNVFYSITPELAGDEAFGQMVELGYDPNNSAQVARWNRLTDGAYRDYLRAQNSNPNRDYSETFPDFLNNRQYQVHSSGIKGLHGLMTNDGLKKDPAAQMILNSEVFSDVAKDWNSMKNEDAFKGVDTQQGLQNVLKTYQTGWNDLSKEEKARFNNAAKSGDHELANKNQTGFSIFVLSSQP